MLPLGLLALAACQVQEAVQPPHAAKRAAVQSCSALREPTVPRSTKEAKVDLSLAVVGAQNPACSEWTPGEVTGLAQRILEATSEPQELVVVLADTGSCEACKGGGGVAFRFHSELERLSGQAFEERAVDAGNEGSPALLIGSGWALDAGAHQYSYPDGAGRYARVRITGKAGLRVELLASAAGRGEANAKRRDFQWRHLLASVSSSPAQVGVIAGDFGAAFGEEREPWMESFKSLASFGSQTAQCEDAPERALHFGQTHAVAVAPAESPFRLAPERLSFLSGPESDTTLQLTQEKACHALEFTQFELTRTKQDSDADRIPDELDNCPLVANQQQENRDSDALGDACDNCPEHENLVQTDGDKDKVGDACDDDWDQDGRSTSDDNCPQLKNPEQCNADCDQLGDACDQDDDDDDLLDAVDLCPEVAAKPASAGAPPRIPGGSGQALLPFDRFIIACSPSAKDPAELRALPRLAKRGVAAPECAALGASASAAASALSGPLRLARAKAIVESKGGCNGSASPSCGACAPSLRPELTEPAGPDPSPATPSELSPEGDPSPEAESE